MTGKLVSKTVSVFVRRPDGQHFNPPRKQEKEVLTFDLDYGPRRKERQEKERQVRLNEWRKLSPEQQLAELERRIPEGANKQKAKLRERIKMAEDMAKQNEQKRQTEQKRDQEIRQRRFEKNQRREQKNKRN